MIRIEVYDKDFNPLTTFFDVDFNNLTHTQAMGRVGSAQFIMDINNQKINEQVLRHFNRIEVVDQTGVRFVGYIDYKKIVDNLITIQCSSLIGILKKRVLPNNFDLDGLVDDFLRDLLNSVNDFDDTGISVGTMDTAKSVNKSFTDTTIYSIIETIAQTLNAEFEVDKQRRLNFRQFVGKDLRASIRFIHDYQRPQQNNLLKVDYADDGDTITTGAIGRTGGGLRAGFSAPAYVERYGIIEKFVNLSNSLSLADLQEATKRLLQQNTYSVSLSIKPDIADNFEVGDFVKVYIRNRLNTLDADYQILRKVVQYKGDGQRQISVGLSGLETGFVDEVSDISKRTRLVESVVTYDIPQRFTSVEGDIDSLDSRVEAIENYLSG